MEAPEGYELPKWYAVLVTTIVVICVVCFLGGIAWSLTATTDEAEYTGSVVSLFSGIVLITVGVNESRKSWRAKDFVEAIRRRSR